MIWKDWWSGYRIVMEYTYYSIDGVDSLIIMMERTQISEEVDRFYGIR